MRSAPYPYYLSNFGDGYSSQQEFISETEVIETDKDFYESCGVPLHQFSPRKVCTSKNESHCFVIGETGCGKTRRVVIPAILFKAKTKESLIISDPKGEIYKDTVDFLKEHSYKIKVLNFRNPKQSDRWNPLARIEKLYKSGTSSSRDKAIDLLSDIAAMLKKTVKSERDPYWELCAADLFTGLSLFIMEYGNTGELTFENLAILAQSIMDEINTTEPVPLNEPAPTPFITLYRNMPPTSLIKRNLGSFINNAPITQKGIFSEFTAMISLYTSRETLLDLFSTSDIDFESIGKEPTALFFILPDDRDTLYPIATAFVQQLYSALVSLADSTEDGKLPNKVTFMLEEFANFSKIPSIGSMLTAARSRAIRFVLVCQAMNQLEQKYEKDYQTLMSNCRTWIYMNTRNVDFLKQLVTLAGQYKSPYTGVSENLLSVPMLQHLQMGQVLIFNDRCKPFMGYLPDFSKYSQTKNTKNKTTHISDFVHKEYDRPIFDVPAAIDKASRAPVHSTGAKRKHRITSTTTMHIDTLINNPDYPEGAGSDSSAGNNGSSGSNGGTGSGSGTQNYAEKSFVDKEYATGFSIDDISDGYNYYDSFSNEDITAGKSGSSSVKSDNPDSDRFVDDCFDRWSDDIEDYEIANVDTGDYFDDNFDNEYNDYKPDEESNDIKPEEPDGRREEPDGETADKSVSDSIISSISHASDQLEISRITSLLTGSSEDGDDDFDGDESFGDEDDGNEYETDESSAANDSLQAYEEKISELYAALNPLNTESSDDN